MPSIAQDFTQTRTARWLQDAQTGHQAARADHLQCFEAFRGILSAYGMASMDGQRRQGPVQPPGLLKGVAREACFSSASVYQRWSAKQVGRAIRHWAGPDPHLTSCDSFVAEAKIVSFWPYRAGAISIADTFEMPLTEVAAS